MTYFFNVWLILYIRTFHYEYLIFSPFRRGSWCNRRGSCRFKKVPSFFPLFLPFQRSWGVSGRVGKKDNGLKVGGEEGNAWTSFHDIPRFPNQRSCPRTNDSLLLTFSIFGAVYGMQSSLRMMRAWVTETAREVGEGKQASFSSSLHSWRSRIRIVSRPVGNVRFYVGQRSRQNSFTWWKGADSAGAAN